MSAIAAPLGHSCRMSEMAQAFRVTDQIDSKIYTRIWILTGV